MDLYKLKEEYETRKAWGLLTTIDMHNCDAKLIRDGNYIRKFIIELCSLIKMKRCGEPKIVYFDDNRPIPGYSMMQLIETSLISGHFVNEDNSAFIDIFSCKFYNPNEAAEFTQRYFKARNYTINTLIRR